MIEVLEECVVPNFRMEGIPLRLVMDTSHVFTEYRIERVFSKIDVQPKHLSFWGKVRWLFSGREYPMELHPEIKYVTVFDIEDFEPDDPYAENCAREVWDYLTKDYNI